MAKPIETLPGEPAIRITGLGVENRVAESVLDVVSCRRSEIERRTGCGARQCRRDHGLPRAKNEGLTLRLDNRNREPPDPLRVQYTYDHSLLATAYPPCTCM